MGAAPEGPYRPREGERRRPRRLLELVVVAVDEGRCPRLLLQGGGCGGGNRPDVRGEKFPGLGRSGKGSWSSRLCKAVVAQSGASPTEGVGGTALERRGVGRQVEGEAVAPKCSASSLLRVSIIFLSPSKILRTIEFPHAIVVVLEID
ncbi:hypothetical protein HPB52_012118 [Rhipicephalus sanguineus]|uniref:Uncharacterized protein n=1 Tax=Rhipicephalus sanguineus TaxID=34632 RepID=A0A9D4Q9L1_RHISA|nr:hypothetical protein HPB52_012118 [Rhipicephalus sanguineus]